MNHRTIVFAQPRMYKCDFLPPPEHLFNKWVQRWGVKRASLSLSEIRFSSEDY